MVRIAAQRRMILELAEAPRKGDVLGARDVLIAQEQHLVLEQQRLDFCKQRVVARSVAETDAEQLGADAASQLFYAHGSPLLR